MKTVGIIAEYNPFHLGHAYQIRRAKEEAGADFAIIVMSGNFVQRGAPAVIDKYTRTKMALAGGADLVLELPVPFATAAAPIFAEAGVALLDCLGCTDVLCFGSESADLSSLISTARILSEEPAEYKVRLQQLLKEGNSYPKSVSLAAQALSDACSAPSSPNDTLAVEYIKALLKRNSPIEPLAIKREGNGYHETDLSSGFASASAIRKQIEEGDDLSFLAPFLPKTSFSLMQEKYGHTFPVTEDDLSLALGIVLCFGKMTNGMPISKAADMTKELSDRIMRTLSCGQTFSFSALAEALKTKNITRARINRALLHCLLSISQDDMDLFRDSHFCSYARILGFQKSAAELLHAIKKNAGVPILTKIADAKKQLDETGSKILSHELNASFLYRQAVQCRFGENLPDEYRARIVVM